MLQYSKWLWFALVVVLLNSRSVQSLNTATLSSLSIDNFAQTVIVVAEGNIVYVSFDRGVTWSWPDQKIAEMNCQFLKINHRTNKFFATGPRNCIYMASNKNLLWECTDAPMSMWNSLSVSVESSRMLATAGRNGLYISLNDGEKWLKVDIEDQNWQKTLLSASGTMMIAISNDGNVYTSDNDWKSWKLSLHVPHNTLLDICMSHLGDQIFVISAESNLYHSADYGKTWQVRYSSSSLGFAQIVCDEIGRNILLSTTTIGVLLHSNTFGNDWEELVSGPRVHWKSVSMDASGKYIFGIGENDASIYSSKDFGVSWTTLTLPSMPLNENKYSKMFTEHPSTNNEFNKNKNNWKDIDIVNSQPASAVIPTINPSASPTFVLPSPSVPEINWLKVNTSTFTALLDIYFTTPAKFTGLVYCKAYDVGLSMSSDLASDLLLNSASSWYPERTQHVELQISSLEPESKYEVYCLVTNALGLHSTLHQIYSTKTTFITTCCKRVDVLESPSFRVNSPKFSKPEDVVSSNEQRSFPTLLKAMIDVKTNSTIDHYRITTYDTSLQTPKGIIAFSCCVVFAMMIGAILFYRWDRQVEVMKKRHKNKKHSEVSSTETTQQGVLLEHDHLKNILVDSIATLFLSNESSSQRARWTASTNSIASNKVRLESRTVQWIGLLGNILVLVFMNSLFVALFFPDDGTCESYHTEDSCHSKQQILFPSTSLCSWHIDYDMEQPTEDVINGTASCRLNNHLPHYSVLIIAATVIALLAIPILVILEKIRLEILSKQPMIEELTTNNSWLGYILPLYTMAMKKNISSTKKLPFDHKFHHHQDDDKHEHWQNEFLSRMAFDDNASVFIEVGHLLISIEELFTHPMNSTTRRRSKEHMHIQAAKKFAIQNELGMSINANFTITKSSSFLATLFANPSQPQIEHVITVARISARQLANTLYRISIDDQDTTTTIEMYLVHAFLQEQLSSISKCAFQYYLYYWPPFHYTITVNSYVWLFAALFSSMIYLTCFVWTIDWCLRSGSNVIPIWGYLFALVIVQECIYQEIMKHSFIHNLTFTVMKPQLSSIYQTLLDIIARLERQEEHQLTGWEEFHSLRIIQHISPVCRVSRLPSFVDLPIARLFHYIDDADRYHCQQERVASQQLSFLEKLCMCLFTLPAMFHGTKHSSLVIEILLRVLFPISYALGILIFAVMFEYDRVIFIVIVLVLVLWFSLTYYIPQRYHDLLQIVDIGRTNITFLIADAFHSILRKLMKIFSHDIVVPTLFPWNENHQTQVHEDEVWKLINLPTAYDTRWNQLQENQGTVVHGEINELLMHKQRDLQNSISVLGKDESVEIIFRSEITENLPPVVLPLGGLVPSNDKENADIALHPIQSDENEISPSSIHSLNGMKEVGVDSPWIKVVNDVNI